MYLKHKTLISSARANKCWLAGWRNGMTISFTFKNIFWPRWKCSLLWLIQYNIYSLVLHFCLWNAKFLFCDLKLSLRFEKLHLGFYSRLSSGLPFAFCVSLVCHGMLNLLFVKPVWIYSLLSKRGWPWASLANGAALKTYCVTVGLLHLFLSRRSNWGKIFLFFI